MIIEIYINKIKFLIKTLYIIIKKKIYNDYVGKNDNSGIINKKSSNAANVLISIESFIFNTNCFNETFGNLLFTFSIGSVFCNDIIIILSSYYFLFIIILLLYFYHHNNNNISIL